MPKVSVIISTYNRPELLHQAVQSVVDQRFKDWELIVLNDGGECVRDIVEEFQYSPDYHHLDIFYMSDGVNRGAAYRFNEGLNHAQGDYIAWLGDDDLWYPNHLEVLVPALDAAPDDVCLVYSDLYAVRCIGEGVNRKPIQKQVEVCRNFNRVMLWNFNLAVQVSVLHRREAALEVGGFEDVPGLVEWGLFRKLAFKWDFQRVPVLTGEYYIGGSDRISEKRKRDPEADMWTQVRIRAARPPHPWPKVETVDVIWPVGPAAEKNFYSAFEQAVRATIYPVRWCLINMTGQSEEEFKTFLLGNYDLPNVVIWRGPIIRQTLQDIYNWAARESTAEWLFLLGPGFRPINYRIAAGVEAANFHGKDACRWDIEGEKFNWLIRRTAYNRARPGVEVECAVLNEWALPSALGSDLEMVKLKADIANFKWESAEERLTRIEAMDGAPGMELMVKYWFPVLVGQQRYDEAKNMLDGLMLDGYEADNLVRAAELVEKTHTRSMAEFYWQDAADHLGLDMADIKDGTFPEDSDAWKIQRGLEDPFEQFGDFSSEVAA